MNETFEKPSLAPFAAVDGKVFTYQVVVRGSHVMHLWSLADEKGGIHVSASLTEWQSGGREWMGGAETHYAAAPDYMNPDEPSHEHCWVLGKPCWHDGSSLYFSENIAHMLPSPWSETPNQMEQRHHDYVLFELRYLYRLRFEDEVE